MKAIICPRHGTPDVLQYKEVDKPTMKDRDVLVRVKGMAVQVAKNLGLKVTAVAGSTNQQLIKDLGADETLDYTAPDFTTSLGQYNLVF